VGRRGRLAMIAISERRVRSIAFLAFIVSRGQTLERHAFPTLADS
jgi:hypothetical protein